MNSSPEWNASILSRLSFTWYDGLIKTGYKRPLVMSDIYDLSEKFKSKQICERFYQHWSYPDKSNILVALLKTFWPRLVGAAALQIFVIILIFVSPAVLDHLLIWLAGDEPQWHGYVYAATMFLAPFAKSILHNQYEYMGVVSGMQMRTAVTSALHRKALKLSPIAKSEFTAGEVSNLMSIDNVNLVHYITFANMWWIASLQVIIAMAMLWQQLGVAAVAGIAVMVASFPLNGYITKKLVNTYGTLMEKKDSRSKLMNEIINGVKVLKMYAWEKPLSDQVTTIRNKEIGELKIQALLLSFIVFILDCTPAFVAIVSFMTYTLLDKDNVLDPSKVFVSLALFNIIQAPLLQFPILLNAGAKFSIAKKRVNAFLSCDEFDPEDIGRQNILGTAIKISDGEFSWGKDDVSTLCNINLNIKKRKLIAVVGTVGSGKSSLISALLGEMKRVSGQINISGSVAYVPQQAWIQNATVKHNIVFSGALDDVKYEKVLRSCALEPDLKILEAGDQTEIGEKGINLSGGQKQRVSLARAVYADRDVYLLDDPLSAVDSHVGKHIFDQVIGPEGMLKNSTRILVTHRVALLPQVDEIVVMKDGRISEHGSYLQLLERKGDFADFLAEYVTEAEEDLEVSETVVSPELERRVSRSSTISSNRKNSSARSRRSTLIQYDDRYEKQDELENGDTIEATGDASKGKLVEAESAETGSVKWTIYLEYFRTVGITLCIANLTVNVLINILTTASTLWLKEWSDDARYPERANDVDLRYVRLGVYGLLGISQAALMFVCYLITFFGALKASKILHEKMLNHILRAPMSFFDTTPSGRILNRFSKDIDTMDLELRIRTCQFVMTLFETLFTFLIIAFQTALFLPPIIILSVLYYFVQKYYIMTSRQLLRLESNSRSPVYSQFSETVSGTTSIRAFQVEEYFNLECDRKNDIQNATHLLSVTAARWLSVRLEFLGNLIVLLAVFFAVYSRGETEASTVGFFLSYALVATHKVNGFITACADLENNLVSVERSIEYTKTPTEAELEIEATQPKPSWPENGNIQFESYATRYREGLDLVLKDLSFTVKAGEKVGIVGRTGAGKSSLTIALFRIVEPAAGTIVIDGVDVSTIGLHSLRSGLTIIPQDPVLFTGSLRINLDPFGRYDDSELWTALKLAHLKKFVKSLEGGLEHVITEGGDNLSVGQRQLVCLARALLRKSKILVLDEATAAVDLETDDLIQETIRNEFHDCTILTIAHRLNTILDYDRVLVMDKGTVAEFETPKTLLANEDSVFHSMAKDAGLSAADLNREKPISMRV